MCGIFCGNEMEVRGEDRPLADFLKKKHTMDLIFSLVFWELDSVG